MTPSTRSRSRRLRDLQARLRLELLEDRNLLANGLWYAAFAGLSPAANVADQATYGTNLLQFAGIGDQAVRVNRALDLSGTFVLQTATTVTLADLNAQLQAVPGFLFAQDYTEQDPTVDPAALARQTPAAARSEAMFGPFDYDTFLSREKNGEFPDQGGPVDSEPLDSLTNNNTGSTGTSLFTQSETTVVAWGNNVLVGYNDSGSNSGGTNKFTGFSRSTDGGATFTDGGVLPTSTVGDAGDPVMARNDTTGRIYFSTLGFSAPGTIQMFRSDDGGVSWMAPVNATPGGSSEDKQWHTVDNYPGAGNGNVYLLSRRFGAGPGIYFFRSTDHGDTFGPSGGTLIVSGSQGAYVAVGPDHSIYAFWYAGTTIQMRKSTDFGATFGAPVTVATGLVGGVNGDLALTGRRQGLTTFSGFRSNEFPHAAVNPVNGNIYVVHANNPAGTDKADIFLTQSTDGGATWTPSTRVNDDATLTDQWQPTLAVSTDGSRLGVFYYSRQEDPTDNNLFKYYGRIATLSGATTTFLPSFAVSDVPSLPEFGRDSLVNSVYMGDYDTAHASPGFFNVTWSDNRDDLAGGAPRKDPSVYFERIALGLAVVSTDPAAGSTVSVPPTVFTVNVTDPLNPATVDAGDFLVNGIAATSVDYTAGTTTLTFTFATSPVTAEGLQTMHVDAGAFTSAADDTPVNAFDATFRYDAVALTVTSTDPPVGGTFVLPGPFTYDVNFNESIDPSSVATTDLALSGIAGAFVSAVTVLPGNTTARFTLSGITVEGSLTASIPAGAITDAFGNGNTAFSGTYAVDIGTVPYPTPLTAEAPLGSLIYDPTASGVASFAGDVDSFTLALDAGQTITVLLTPNVPGLQPSIEVKDPANAVIAASTAGAAGQIALVQTVATTTAGTYTFAVSGANGTVGAYTLRVVLNAALEREGFAGGSSNDTTGTAENVDGSFVTVSTPLATASRGAVQGISDNVNYTAAAVPFAFEDISTTGTVITGLTNVDDTSVTVTPAGFSFPLFGTTQTSLAVSSNGIITFGGTFSTFTNTDLTASPTLAAIAPFWDDLHTAGGAADSNVFFQVLGSGADQHLTVQWNNIRFFSGGTAGDTITFQAQLYFDGRIQLNYLDLVSGTAGGNNGASATVGIKAAGAQGPSRLLLAFNNGPNAFVGTGQSTLISPPNPTPDLYSFTATAGETLTLATRSLGGGVASIDLLDAGGGVLASGVGGSINLDRTIANFVAGTTGTYYARVVGTVSAPYDLVLTRNAAFDTEANDSAATAQPLAGNRGVLGFLGASTNTQTLVWTDSGWWDSPGSHTATNKNYLTGQSGAPRELRSFFVFDLASVTQPITGATLRLFNPSGGYSSPDPTETYTLFDVSTSIPTLRASGTGQVGVFTDLGTGTSFGSLVVSAANNNTIVSIPINGAGVAALNAAVGGLFAVGGANTTIAGTANQFVFGFTGAATNTRELVLNLGPGEDWYSVTLGAGETAVRVETSTPADGPGQFVNAFNPKIELWDVTGTTLIASGLVGPDGRNESITATGLAAGGTYKVRILADGGTTGEYFLGVTALRTPTPTVLVDNTNFGFTTRGPWSLVAGAYNGTYRTNPGNGDGSDYVQWQYGQNFTAGTSYEFYVTWVAAPGNATNARYKVFDGATQIATVTLDQTRTPNTALVNGALWQSLYVYTAPATGFRVLRVQLDNSGNGTVVADALFDPPIGGTASTLVGLPAMATAPMAAFDSAFSIRDGMSSRGLSANRSDLAQALLLPGRELQGGFRSAFDRSTKRSEDLVVTVSSPLDGAFVLLGDRNARLESLTRTRRGSLAARFDTTDSFAEENGGSETSEATVAEEEPHQG